MDSGLLSAKFRGCLLGSAIGDVVGAAVEAESPAYIAKTFRSVDDILAAGTVEEFTGPPWQVGRFTDDTQMTICVAEWLVAREAPDPARLLNRFADAFEPWRRYGAGTERLLRLYPDHRDRWRELATAQFPHGSYGNGSAMRVAPVGLAFFDDPETLTSVAIESSRPTHSHPLALQGAALQATAVALAVRSSDTPAPADLFLRELRDALRPFRELMWDVSPYAAALDAIERGLARGSPCLEMAAELGTGVEAHQAVPMALYCALRHPDSYAQVIHDATFIGGDTDTIACMAGAISGALLGETSIPAHWVAAVREDKYTPDAITALADRLHATHAPDPHNPAVPKKNQGRLG